IGGGPAGLMAAEVLSAAGVAVTVYDRMPSIGRKFLMAGRGGLNLTHSEAMETFLPRYGAAQARLAPFIEAFPPSALIAWAQGLGQATHVGSSGRVFPTSHKASPLLRAWLERLQAQGVRVLTRHDWLGWANDSHLRFHTPDGETTANPSATILALGGASWPKLGSTGAWSGLLAEQGVAVTTLRPANVGFEAAWSDIFRDRFQGSPLKNVGMSFEGQATRGDAMITREGLEGGAVYALSAPLRDAVAGAGSAVLEIDLRPDQSVGQLTARLAVPRGGQSMTNYLRKAANLSPVEINLLREAHGVELALTAGGLARAIKAAPIRLTAVRPIARAISTAGGVALSEVDEHLMLRARPGVFLAGEMLDWEAPTGGYLLQACFATGVAAANGALLRLTP
ncbi:MAG: putative oxidoreductase, partial [Phenylobacterium sp.]|nr:putative oxidoreductase [Phenylobacterium sp.]